MNAPRFFDAPIHRGVFLHARMAYLAHMRDRGESEIEMIRACNLGDVGQVRLLLATWDDLPADGGPPSPEYVAEIERCNAGMGEEIKRLQKLLGALLVSLPRCAHCDIGRPATRCNSSLPSGYWCDDCSAFWSNHDDPHLQVPWATVIRELERDTLAPSIPALREGNGR
jgi:hypothetical protein